MREVAETVRCGVVAPQAELITEAMGHVTGGGRVRASPVEVAELRDGPGLLVDVVVVAGTWPGAGPDVAEVLHAVRRVSLAPVLVLGQVGDPDVRHDVAAVGGVAGMIGGPVTPARLVAAVEAVALHRPDARVSPLDPTEAVLAPALAEHPCLAAVAMAVVGGATTWAEVAAATGYSIRTVQGTPARYAELVRAGLRLPADTPVTQPLLFHWLGTRAGYLSGWSRRRGGVALAA